MTKHIYIFHKLKANFMILLMVCFALLLCSGIVSAQEAVDISPTPEGSSQVYRSPTDKSSDDSVTFKQDSSYSDYSVTQVDTKFSNETCNRERMDSIYKKGCYSCEVVSALIGTFMSACAYLYDVSKDAGQKVLFIGFFLWIAFYILKQLSSFKNIEPSAMIAEMLTTAFKVLGAYLVIMAGADFFISYAFLPFLQWGAQFGIALLSSVSEASGVDISTIPLDDSYKIAGNDNLTILVNNMQKYVKAVNSTVSTHMEIGHMITCHSTHAGAFDWYLGKIPNIWIWLSGAFIWFFGFMMTLAVTYYLLDVSFKLGFAIIAFPITIGLWPFNITKGKVSACFSIVLQAAGILLFLAMTVAISLALITSALEWTNINETGEALNTAVTEDVGSSSSIISAIENGDSEYIHDRLSLWSFGWIFIFFSYLFALHIIRSTISDFASKFFPDKIFGTANPMHLMLTQATALGTKAVVKPVKFLGKTLKNHAKDPMDALTYRLFHKKNDDESVFDKADEFKTNIDKLSQGDLSGDSSKPKKKSGFKNVQSMTGLDTDKDQKEMEKAAGQRKEENGAGSSMQSAGKAVSDTGKQMQDTADRTEETLNNTNQSVQATNKVVQSGSAALDSTVIGAPVGVTAATASQTAAATSSVSSTAGRAAAKLLKAIGVITEKMGKAMEKSGKLMKKAEKMQKAAQKFKQKAAQFSGENSNQDSSAQNEQIDDFIPKNNGNPDSSDTGSANGKNRN